MFTPPVEDAAERCPACPVESEGYSSGVGQDDRTGVNLKDIQLGPLTIPLGRSAPQVPPCGTVLKRSAPFPLRLRDLPPHFLPINRVLLF
jgi:hypothetical protein